MHFEDVTHRLGAEVDAVGHPGHGASIRDALGLGASRIWRAVYGGYSWVIVYEPGHPSWDAETRAKFVGYSASYRRAGHTKSSRTIRIDDGAVYPSFAAAEEACRRQWRQIRQAT